nr:hypothetical protein [uncultured Flavobacterium sp.]
MSGNTEQPTTKNYYKIIFRILAIILLTNWLFHPVNGVFYDPCISRAITEGLGGYEGKNGWVVLFTQSSDINNMFNNGDAIGISGCGYQWGTKSPEELFFLGPMVIVFTVFLWSGFPATLKTIVERWKKK